MQSALVVKIAVIAGLVLFLLIPLWMIDGVIGERSGYRFQVEQDIAEAWTGTQLIVGPVLAVPYEIRYEEKLWDKKREEFQAVEKTQWKTKYLMPQDLVMDGSVVTEERARGIYSVPVYTGNFSVEGEFSVAELEATRRETQGFSRWGSPRLSLAISDVRGLGTSPGLIWNGTPVSVDAGTEIAVLGEGLHAVLPAPAAGGALRFALELQLRGSRALRIAPIAEEATISLQSTWPHPKFSGRFLPVEREISPQGFTARWQTSSFSTNARQHLAGCLAGDCSALTGNSFGVDFFKSVDIYQKITRATKYGILFILLTFVAFFLTETMLGKALHPVQYVLVGFALSIFYLLLLSLSEHYGFAVSYGMATAACVALIGIYLTGVLGRAGLGFAYASGISLLYAMLFVILRSEDFALLMGTLLLFTMLATVMLMTRRVDWYEIGEKTE